MLSKTADGVLQVFIFPAIKIDVHRDLFVIAMSPQQSLPNCLQQRARTHALSGGGFCNFAFITTRQRRLYFGCFLLRVAVVPRSARRMVMIRSYRVVTSTDLDDFRAWGNRRGRLN